MSSGSFENAMQERAAYLRGSHLMTRPEGAPPPKYWLEKGVSTVQSRAGTTGSTWALSQTPRKGMLAGSIISAQARQRGVGLATVNPLSDQANWTTGGRQTSPAASMANGKGMVGLITVGGIILVLALMMKKK